MTIQTKVHFELWYPYTGLQITVGHLPRGKDYTFTQSMVHDCIFFFITATGKLNVSSVQCNKKLLGSRAKNKKNASPIIHEAKKVCKMIQHAESLSEAPCTSTTPHNTSFDDAINKKSDGENELDDEMIADGKLFKSKATCIIILKPCSIMLLICRHRQITDLRDT